MQSSSLVPGEEEADEELDKAMYAPGETYDLQSCEVQVDEAAQMVFEDELYAGLGFAALSMSSAPSVAAAANGACYASADKQVSARYPGLVMSPENSPRLARALGLTPSGFGVRFRL